MHLPTDLPTYFSPYPATIHHSIHLHTRTTPPKPICCSAGLQFSLSAQYDGGRLFARALHALLEKEGVDDAAGAQRVLGDGPALFESILGQKFQSVSKARSVAVSPAPL